MMQMSYLPLTAACIRLFAWKYKHLYIIEPYITFSLLSHDVKTRKKAYKSKRIVAFTTVGPILLGSVSSC